MKDHPSIKISELKTIVAKKVELLTNGMQQPTFRNEALTADWEL